MIARVIIISFLAIKFMALLYGSNPIVSSISKIDIHTTYDGGVDLNLMGGDSK